MPQVDSTPGSLCCEVSTVEKSSRVYALVRIAAPTALVVPARPPLNLAIVLDRSGSMFGAKLHHAKEAAKFLISQLSPRDRVAVVVYDERVETLLPPTLVENKDEIRIRIDRLEPGGTTNLSGAWLKGASLITSFARPNQINRVLLLTDGIANEGIVEAERLTDIVRAKRAAGIQTSTFGLGEDFQEDLLLALAEAGGGNYYYIENPDSSPKLFARELRGLLSIHAQNLVVAIDAGVEVKLIDCLNGYPAREIAGILEIELGDIYAEEKKVLCIEMVVPAMAEMSDTLLAELRFEYDQIVPDVRHLALTVPLHRKQQGSEDPAAVREMSLFRAARAKERSWHLADTGDFAAASAVLKDASAILRETHPTPDGPLSRELGAIEGLAEQFDRRDYTNTDRKRLFTTSYYQLRGPADLLDTRDPPEVVPPSEG